MRNIINFIKYKQNTVRMKKMPLTKEQKFEIENRVSDVLEKNKDITNGKLYVDMVAIAKKDEFVVEPHKMDIETTGCLFVNDLGNGRTKKTIWVNTDFKNPDREEDVVFKKSRFITAHEYGHHILHGVMSAHRDTYHRTEQIELEADYFASAILMPLNSFKTCYELLRDYSCNDREYIVYALSKIFKVTRKKVRLRISDLEELLN